MKRFVLATVAATALFSGAALAQNDEAAKGGALSGGAAGAVGGAIVGGPVGAAVGGVAGAAAGAIAGSLTPEDRVYVREYTTRREVAPMRVENEIVVGAQLPQTVRIYPIEGNPRLSSYSYARVNGQYYLVDRSHRIIQVIE